MNEIPALYLVDGDIIEDHNCERQFFKGVVGQPKATALAAIIHQRAPEVPVTPVTEYLNENNLRMHRNQWLRPPVLVFGCVDKLGSRCLIEDECVRVSDSILIAGGNEVYDGQVQIFARRNRQHLTPTLSQTAPEVRNYDPALEGAPGGNEEDCLTKGASEPQTALINRAVSVAMEMAAHWFIEDGKIVNRKPPFNEIRIKADEGYMKGFWRDPVPGLENMKTWRQHARTR